MNNNALYLNKIVSFADRIYVDTSTLMEPGFHRFIANNCKSIRTKGKKIIVKNAVYAELARHLQSDYKNKVEFAMNAIALLASNEDLFQVEKTPLTDEKIAKAFADPELLADLIIHKNHCSQLLIVNDFKLSSDAFDLNTQESCKGRKIYVCFINDLGELHCCACARVESEHIPLMKAPVTPVNPIQTIPVATVTSAKSSSTVPQTYTKSPSPIVKQELNQWNFDWKSFGLGVAGTIGTGLLGFGAYKAYKAFAGNNFLLEVVR